MFPFRRRAYQPHDWTICRGDEQLVRLSFTGFSDGFFWEQYAVEFVGVTPAEWEAAYGRDPRDVPWEFVAGQAGRRIPFCAFAITWARAENRISLKYGGFFSTTRSDAWSRLKGWLGSPPPPVPQERAPFGRSRLRRRTVERLLRDADPDHLFEGLELLKTFVSRSQASWASDLFLTYASHESSYARLVALAGLGELARVHGFVDRDRAAAVLLRGSGDTVTAVSEAARKAQAVIARFADADGAIDKPVRR